MTKVFRLPRNYIFTNNFKPPTILLSEFGKWFQKTYVKVKVTLDINRLNIEYISKSINDARNSSQKNKNWWYVYK